MKQRAMAYFELASEVTACLLATALFVAVASKAGLPFGRFCTRPRGVGVPERIRTSDLRFRKPLLYPAELRGRAVGYSISGPIRLAF